MAFQKAPPLLGQRNRMVTRTRDANRLDQPLLAQAPKIPGARIGQSIVMVPEITTGDHPKRADSCKRARFRSA
jgi:hypothetical protein